MSALRSLLQLGQEGGAMSLRSIYVYHTSFDSTRNNNGGCCCLWQPSDDVTWAAFEVWGAGGDGGGGCCCMAGFPGGSGSYGRKILELSNTADFTLCAGAAGCCRPVMGCPGCGSYACSGNGCCGGGYFCLCASGGGYGCAACGFGTAWGGHCGCPNRMCGCVKGADFSICGTNGGGAGTSMCSSSSWENMTGGPMMSHGARMTRDNCYKTHGREADGPAEFPGGGGGTLHTHNGTCYCGGPGAGGLVIVYYQSDIG